jgi:glutaredoxin
MRKWDMVMFTLGGCGHCRQLREGLDTLNIPYTDIDVSNNPNLGDKIEQLYKCYSYPMVVLKEPYNYVWLPNVCSLPSPNVKVYSNTYQLIDEIFNIFNK